MHSMSKVRVQPHVHGRWACHVFIVGDLESLGPEQLDGIVAQLQTDTQIELALEEQPHVSLSKTFYAQHWHLERLQQALFAALQPESVPTELVLDRASRYRNEEATRAFLALDCDEASTAAIRPLVETIDRVLAGFGFAPFYVPPCLHASLCWTSSPLSAEGAFAGFQQAVAGLLPLRLRNVRVMLKMGNKIVRLR